MVQELPEPETRDLGEHVPKITEWVIDSKEYDIFGDVVPIFTPWSHLTGEQKAFLTDENVNTEEEWCHKHASGFGAYVHYLLVRNAKTQVVYKDDPARAAELQPTLWEKALMRVAFDSNICLLYTSDAADE